jgi:2,5-diamino-6-(ribosylamino)-4(3H)-pyrimidinone 5'-phosphate reductase
LHSFEYIEAIVAGEGKVDLGQALSQLNVRYGVKTVRVDSGGALTAVLLQQGLVDQVSLLLHPTLVGGGTRSIYQPGGAGLPAKTIKLRLIHFEKIGDGQLWVNYDVVPETS